jgi:hypothetical protein
LTSGQRLLSVLICGLQALGAAFVLADTSHQKSRSLDDALVLFRAVLSVRDVARWPVETSSPGLLVSCLDQVCADVLSVGVLQRLPLITLTRRSPDSASASASADRYLCLPPPAHPLATCAHCAAPMPLRASPSLLDLLLLCSLELSFSSVCRQRRRADWRRLCFVPAASIAGGFTGFNGR